jgi:hypothetical protein
MPLAIPDISYQLIFCFLPLRELPRISRCSKDWRRIVTAPFFLSMFHQRKSLVIEDETQLTRLLSSPFSQSIRKIKLKHSKVFMRSIHSFFTSSSFDHFIYFNRLESLNMGINWDCSRDFDITPAFKALAPRLVKLKVNMSSNFEHERRSLPPSFFHFQSALSLLTSLNTLTLSAYENDLLSDISFLSCMKKLEKFSCDCIGYVNIHHLMENIQHLGDFTDFLVHKCTQHARFTFRSINSSIQAWSMVDNLQMKELMSRLSLNLEYINIHMGPISLESISKCLKIKTIILYHNQLNVQEFELLSNCKKLEKIKLVDFYINSKNISKSMQQALRMPSSVFPLLRKVEINKEI